MKQQTALYKFRQGSAAILRLALGLAIFSGIAHAADTGVLVPMDKLGRLASVLNHTFDRLEEAFAQQARFTADAAHELRTPVTVLLTHTQNALAVACASEGHQEAFEACQRAAQRMRALIEALLRLARLDSGEEAMHPLEFQLGARVAEVIALVRPLAGVREITLATDLAPASCLGDPGQVDQVVTNLVTNAIHHNVRGGRVRISTRTEGAIAVLTVEDTGPGIP